MRCSSQRLIQSPIRWASSTWVLPSTESISIEVIGRPITRPAAPGACWIWAPKKPGTCCVNGFFDTAEAVKIVKECEARYHATIDPKLVN